MNRMDNSSRRDSGPGRSRAKGAGRNSSGSRARGSASYRSGQAGRMNASQTARKNSSYRRKKDPNYKLIALIGVILLVVILCVALALHSRGQAASVDESSTEASETEIIQEVTVDGVTITGMSKSQAREAILAEFPWAMTVTYGEDTYEVTDLMAQKVDALLDEITAESRRPAIRWILTAWMRRQRRRQRPAQPSGIRRPRTAPLRALTRRTAGLHSPKEKKGFPLTRKS